MVIREVCLFCLMQISNLLMLLIPTNPKLSTWKHDNIQCCTQPIVMLKFY